MTTARKPARPVVLTPPVWFFKVGAITAGVTALYFILYRLLLSGNPFGRPGLSVYFVAMAGVAIYLLFTGRDRIEATDDVIGLYRGERLVQRCPARDIEAVRPGLLSKTLVFKGGRTMAVGHFWSNASRVTSILERHAQAGGGAVKCAGRAS